MSDDRVRYRIDYFMIPADVDKPMGNAELRLSLASIESEVSDTKRISTETHEQARKTNGRVNWMEKCIYVSMGALPLLTAWAGWLTLEVISDQKSEAQTQQEIQDTLQQSVQEGITNALSGYNKTTTP